MVSTSPYVYIPSTYQGCHKYYRHSTSTIDYEYPCSWILFFHYVSSTSLSSFSIVTLPYYQSLSDCNFRLATVTYHLILTIHRSFLILFPTITTVILDFLHFLNNTHIHLPIHSTTITQHHYDLSLVHCFLLIPISTVTLSHSSNEALSSCKHTLKTN